MERKTTNYTVTVSPGNKYVFKDLPMEKNFLGKWKLLYGEVRKCTDAVAKLIIEKPGPITVNELIFLVKVTDTTHEEFSKDVKQYFKEKMT